MLKKEEGGVHATFLDLVFRGAWKLVKVGGARRVGIWEADVQGYHPAVLWPEASPSLLTFLDKQQESCWPYLRDQALHRVPEPEGVSVGI